MADGWHAKLHLVSCSTIYFAVSAKEGKRTVLSLFVVYAALIILLLRFKLLKNFDLPCAFCVVVDTFQKDNYIRCITFSAACLARLSFLLVLTGQVVLVL